MSCTFRATYLSATNEIVLVHEGLADAGFGATSTGSSVSVKRGSTPVPVTYADVWRWSTNHIFLRVSQPQPLSPGTYDVAVNISAAGHPPNGCQSSGSFDVAAAPTTVDPLMFAVIVPSPAILGEKATIVCPFPGFRFDPAQHRIELQNAAGVKAPDPTDQVWSSDGQRIELRMPSKAAYTGYDASNPGHQIQFGSNTSNRLVFQLLPQVAVPSSPALKGNFRVTVSGFKAVKETWDSIIGPHGDEVIAYVRSASMDLPSAGNQCVNFASHPVIWWIHTGDEKGAAKLEDLDSADQDWPVVAWQGELESGRNAVVVCPFLFEQDTGNADNLDLPDFNTALVAGGLPEVTTKGNDIRGLLGLPSLPAAVTNPLAATATLDGVARVLTTASGGPLDITWNATSGHRPIGSEKTPDGNRRSRPFLLVLTYELAKLLTQTPGLSDTITLTYTDTPDDGSGSYEMYLQVKEV